MDPRLLRLYNEELTYLREGAREFGEEHEEVAGRLGFKTPTDPDPYVERLLEGVAFLSARVQLKQQDQFPEFTQQLLQAVEPHYLAPMPSICIAGFEPKLGDPALVTGHVVPKGTELAATATAHNNASVVFRTGHDVTLWPIEIEQVEYLGSRASVAQFAAAANVSAEAGLRLRFKAAGGHALADIRPDAVALYLDGSEAVPGELYRQLCGDALAVVARDAAAAGTTPWVRLPLPAQLGFDEAEALLPTERRAFSGYRLLSEYFACPERFLFVELREPGRAFAQSAEACDIVVLFGRAAAPLVRTLTPANFRLFATPAINLVERQLGRVAIMPHTHEYHVIPDRTRPLDFEVFRLLDVQAHARDHSETRPVAPLYAYGSLLYDWQDALFYTVQFRQRRLSVKEQRLRRRTDYIGTETWISLTAPGNPDRLAEVHELGIRALVTNRELPELLTFRGDTHFTVSGQPVNGARVLRSPTRPRPPLGIGDAAWRVIGHLTPNYLTLVGEGQEDAPLLRDHLTLYGRQDDPALRRQVDAIRGIRSRIVTRRLPGVDRLAVARGRHIHLELDDAGFDNARLFLFAALIERFLADFTTINSFTETSVSTSLEGTFVRWPARIGRRHTI